MPVEDYLKPQKRFAHLFGANGHSEMLAQIHGFVQRWLPSFEDDQRSYLTVAIGCTGGQHRSVYLAEQLARHFAGRWTLRVRHRESDHWPRPGQG